MIVLRKGDRMISIDEYIEYLEQCADITKGSDEGDRLSRQHTQLAVWLKELKGQRWLLEDIQDTCEYLYLENIRYRTCLMDDAENARQILGESREIRAENAKLRELARQMYPAAKAFLQLGVQLGCNDTLSYDWWLQLRELGIEVE